MKKKFLMLLSIAVLAVFTLTSAQAASISQVRYFGGTPNYETPLTFAQYNGPDTLVSIEVILDLSMFGGSLGVDNDGVDPATVAVELGASGSISSSDVGLIDVAFQPVVSDIDLSNGTTFTLAADDGDGPVIDTTGPDGAVFIGATTPIFGQDSGFINSAAFSGYIGAGSFDIIAAIDQIMNTGSVGGVEGTFSPVSTGGSVTVIYTTETPSVPVPAAGFLLFTGLTGLVALRRRSL